jgi:isopentenyl phosphate kinase
MIFLTDHLRPARILLFGETSGVLHTPHPQETQESLVIPYITPANLKAVSGSLGDARGRDVTGGMASKVMQMLALVQKHPGLRVHILSGLEDGLLRRALLDPDTQAGTRIVAFAPPRAD